MRAGVALQVQVLGTIQVVDGDSPVPLSPQLGRLLGILVVADGAPVSADRLAEYVADGNVDGSSVRTAVSRLRKVLDGGVESTPAGYRLALEEIDVDLARFDQLRARARSAPPEVVASSLTAALDLWRGPAFGGMADEEWATATASRLDNARATATEDLAEALLDIGRHAAAVERLDGHVVEHPYRERPVALLMRALAASGRTAEGVRVFHRFRATLREDTGLEPSASLVALEGELLAATARSSGDAPGPTLPDGTVTFLFSDIEGSTERWQSDEDQMSSALAAHDAVLRDAVGARGGIVFKHTGDGVCAVFTSAAGAVQAAIDAQLRVGLPIRIGLHTGEAERRGHDYFGPTLNRAARVMDAGHGGQVLMSAATAALAGDVDRTDLGEHLLKGLSRPERIFQVGHQQFPPLRVAHRRRGNLPTDLSNFVGRSAELESIAEHVAEHRLVTLLGVGGTGKTRLSIEAAEVLAPAFPDGCWLSELAVVSAGDAVPFAVAAGLGIAAPESGDIIEHIVARIRNQRLLLIIDNCEHLLGDVADAVERLADGCPTLTILATSREPLMVSGEHLVPVPSLGHDDARRLFLDRARSEAPDLVLDEVQSRAVDELCDRLDRLPLAIELAASRLRSLTPVEILDHLDERFRLLVGGRRSRMERHQTMRGTVDWSYELCDPTERAVFDRLSVFPATFDTRAACAVAGDDELDALDVTDALGRLVDRSLVQRTTGDDGTSRFRLLETMRAYGREHLRDHGLADVVRRRHAEHTASTIAALALRSLGPDEDEVHRRMRERTADAAVALDWCIDHRSWDVAYQLMGIGMPDASREYFDLGARLNAAFVADPDPRVADPTAPLVIGLFDLRRRIEDAAAIDAARDRLISSLLAIIGDGWTPAADLFTNPPHYLFADEFDLGREQVELVVGSLRDATSWPPVTRFLALVGVFRVASAHPDLLPGVRAAFDEATEALDSAFARRRHASEVGLEEELAGDRAAALAHFERALECRTDLYSFHDIATAFRILRNRAFLGLEITWEHLGRPWQAVVDESMWPQRDNGLLSSVPALDLLGHGDLADRLLGRLRYEHPGDAVDGYFLPHMTASNLIERFLDAEPDQTPVELLVDEIIRVAEAHPAAPA